MVFGPCELLPKKSNNGGIGWVRTLPLLKVPSNLTIANIFCKNHLGTFQRKSTLTWLEIVTLSGTFSMSLCPHRC